MKITYSRLRIDTLLTLAKRTIETSEKPEFASIVKDHLLLLQLKITYAVIFSVFNKESFSGLGKEVYSADLKRDSFLKGMLRVLTGMAAMEGMSLQKDAHELLMLFDTYGAEITRLSYGDESAYLNKLIEMLDKPEIVDKLEKLNLKESFELLKQSQMDFENLFSTQVQVNATLRNMQSASSLKTTLVRDLRNYLNIVNAMRNLDTWKDLYSELNEFAKAANGSIAAPTEEKLPSPPIPLS